MDNELNDYKFDDMTITLPRQWVPIKELEGLANQLGFEASNLKDVFKNYGIDTQGEFADYDGIHEGEHADFNGVNFFLLHKGQISAEFLAKIIKHNFDNDYVDLGDFTSYLEELQKSIGQGISKQEVNAVVSVLKDLVS